jgi:flagellar assembly factor FliW
MPSFASKYFGILNYQEKSVIEFPRGLPGFADEKQFVVIEQPETKPLVFLQSLRRAELCFLTVPVLALYPDYQLSICDEDLQLLGFPANHEPCIGAEIVCLGIISLSKDRPPTINLLAPVIINWRLGRAVQVVQSETCYSHEHPLSETARAPLCW